jgi:hypothetical protein
MDSLGGTRYVEPRISWPQAESYNVSRSTMSGLNTNLLIDIACWEICLEPALRLLVVVIVSQTEGFLYLVVLVIPGKYHETGVVPQPSDILCCFFANRLKKVRERWIVSTPKHEILPAQDAHLVAEVVEDVLLVDTASPYSSTP